MKQALVLPSKSLAFPISLSLAMERLIEDATLRAAMIRRGLEWCSRWTWERCARGTLAVYRDAAAAEPLAGERKERVARAVLRRS